MIMNSKYLTTIGLEVHVQLNSKTKIFCGCEIRFGAPPNSQVCPVCLGLPGVLPVLNHQAFRLGLRAVLALRGTPSKRIKFDRKNYYYPDLPKGYQISQYDCPLGQGGALEIETEGRLKKIRLTRAHLEEDAGKLMHDISAAASHVDLNRAGTPLLEIVSEPELETPEEAYQYLTHLKAIIKSIGVSECNMEKGHLRCDANVSVRKNASDLLGKKVEIKNLNSFKAVKAALQYEIKRQTEALEKGEAIPQETRLWDDLKQKTLSMRSKEEAHDYRYFPEPDLVPFFVTQEEIDRELASLPELPKEKAERFARDYGLTTYDAGLLTQSSGIADFFEDCASGFPGHKTIVNWVIGPISAYLNEASLEFEALKLAPETLIRLIKLVESGQLSFQTAKEKVFPEVLKTHRDPEEVMKEKGLAQVSDEGALDAWIAEAIQAHPKVVSDFKSGKETAAMFLVGQVMKKSRGTANPGKVQELMKKKLKELV